MCDLGHGDHHHFGFIVDTPEIRTLVDETQRLMQAIPDDRMRVNELRTTFAKLLAADAWLPDKYATPDYTSGMGGGIGQYALYRA